MKEQTPINWLWLQLATILPTQDYLALQIGYQQQQRRYNRQARLNQARRELKQYERTIKTCAESRRSHYDGLIERRKAVIARLEQEP